MIRIFLKFRGTSDWVPRRKTSVKIKTMGAVDIHFHGAFGIDLMTAEAPKLDELAWRLGQQGLAAFCATTLSVPHPQLLESVRRIGAWISSRKRSALAVKPGAIPLGIHLEGPYIHPEACGAHPPEAIRPLQMSELDELWQESQGTLKILTIAPETLARSQMSRLVRWAQAKCIVLSLGHSRANEVQAKSAFDSGFRGVTHAWNALAFHHRDPGPLGAALGRPDVHLELILDQVHVAPQVIRWTRALHGDALCYVSDCVPAAATRPGTWHSFGHLRIQAKDGACHLEGDHLAGGAVLLPEAFRRWVQAERLRTGRPASRILREQIGHITSAPLRYLGLPQREVERLQRERKVEWSIAKGEKSGKLIQVRSTF